MSTFSWLGAIQTLSPAALTVRAQTISPNDEGRLLWDVFFPRVNEDSVDLADVTTTNYRPVSDRREWNGRGRLIPDVTPTTRAVSIVPVESYFKVDEYEIQKLNERALGNASVIQNIIGTSLPSRVDRLAQANFRRMELDMIEAWTRGRIIQRNPQRGDTYTASFGFSASRLLTAGTAWNDGTVNAYNLLLDFLATGLDLVGPGEGVMLRLATFQAIQADAPNPFGNTSPKLTRTDLEARIQDETGTPFRFFVNENTMDVFDDGGIAYTSTKVWPTGYLAYVPAGRRVGKMSHAPVVRAMQMSAANNTASLDLRGQTVYFDAAGAGRDLTVECQINAAPIPDENKVLVIATGV